MKDMAAYMATRRKNRRRILMEMAGGQCQTCNSTERLEFDHRDRLTKNFVLSGRHLDKSWTTILLELAKCDLLCHDCHLKRTVQQISVGHGEGASGKKNCSCTPCKTRKAEYMTEYLKTYVRKRDR